MTQESGRRDAKGSRTGHNFGRLALFVMIVGIMLAAGILSLT